MIMSRMLNAWKYARSSCPATKSRTSMSISGRFASLPVWWQMNLSSRLKITLVWSRSTCSSVSAKSRSSRYDSRMRVVVRSSACGFSLIMNEYSLPQSCEFTRWQLLRIAPFFIQLFTIFLLQSQHWFLTSIRLFYENYCLYSNQFFKQTINIIIQ
uniref:Uncharacterized protein n=1 Tax=Spironucleus salmonicida TaxID=348837 RepID=V6LV02_9EUKA|eukprot:EST47531.1 Hypothetical protein SS50377_12515 [Spironucleus salmonicida]